MTLKTEEAIKIAEQIQEDILREKEASTQTLLRQYYSLVTLLNKEDEVEWALYELNGYRLISKVPNYRKKSNNQNRHVFITNNCGMIEGMLQTRKNYTYNCIEPPQTPLTKKYVYSNHIANTVSVGARDFFNILNTLTNLIYTKTQQILLEIKFGKFEFDIFEETRRVVDTELSKKCPKALEKLTEAYEDLMKSESMLDSQQTALASRVILKDFADSIYPASDKKIMGFDGKQHTLKDDDYINRIIASIQESTSSESEKEFMEDYLKYLESYLVSLNSMANKGLHHEKSREYANRCLIYTYLALGDIIKLLEKH